MGRDLMHQPVLELAKERQRGGNGRVGAAHVNPRDAYREVPVLVRPTWNHEIAAYFYFGGISSGAFVIGALADTLGGDQLRGMARTAHAVAFATMLPCPPLLIADLGVASRFHHMLRIFKPSSPMNLGAWTLTVHGALSTLLALGLVPALERLPYLGKVLAALPERPIAVGGIPSALTLGGYTGVLLGTTSVPVWATSPFLGGLFMASSMSTGAAAVSLVEALRGGTSTAAAALAPLNAAFGAAELAVLGGYVASSGPAARTLAKGKARLLLSGAAVAAAAGVTLEVVGRNAGPNRRLFSALAAGATLLGGALLRWGVVGAGHDSAEDREETLRATSPSPSAPGWGAAV